MSKGLIQAAASLVILGIAYWGYARIVVPWIEPKLADRIAGLEHLDQAHKDYKISDEKFRPFIDSLFPQGSWERGENVAIVSSGEFLLLMQDYRRLDDGRLHLNPCTIVYRTDGNLETKNARTWTVQAEEGAVVTFDQDIDPKSGKLGNPQSGYLAGRVVISGSPTAPDGSDGIQVDTSGVQFSRDTISTTNEVHFRIGHSFGSGRDLNIWLDALPGTSGTDPTTTAPRLPSPAPSAIRKIELVHLERATVFLPQSRALALGRPSGPGIPIHVACTGSVIVDFQQEMASLNGNVQLVRKRDAAAPEQLHCDLLAVTFRRLLPGSNEPLSSGKDRRHRFSTRIPKLEMQKVIAVGQPAILTTTTESSDGQRWHQMATNRLEYQLSNLHQPIRGGRPTSPGALGNVFAQGPGEYQTGLSNPDSPVSTDLKLSWTQGLQIAQTAEASTGLQRCELAVSGDTRCELPAMGTVQSQRMRIRMSQMDTSSRSFQLEDIFAEADVKIETEQMIAFVNSMTIEVQAMAPLHAPIAGVRPSNEANQEPQLLLIAPDGASVANAPRRFQVEGELLQATLLRIGDDYQISNVSLDRNVRCVELVSDGETASNVEMKGNRFQLENLDATGGLAVIHGSPAEIRIPQMRLVGRSIHLDRDRNQLWIDGAGAAVVPLPVTMAERYPNRPPNADIRWDGGMKFDGTSIDCHDSVLVRGPAQDIRTDQMVARLTQTIDFGSRGLDDDRIQLHSLMAVGNVHLENRAFDHRGLVSIDRARVERLTMNHQAEQIQGTGPGWIQTVRRGNPLAPTEDPRQRQTTSAAGLSFLHVGFDRSFEGELTKRILTFRGDVQSIYGPVTDWEDRIASTSHRDLKPQTVRMKCEQLDVFQVPGQAKDKVELMATGKTYVEGKSTEGQLFAAQAHRLSYHQSKDLMMLQGDGRSDAQLWYQQNAGAAWSRLPAQQIRYWPKKNRYKLEGANAFEINLGG